MGLLIPGFAVGIGWLFLLHPKIGIINQWLIALFGLEEAPFNVATIIGMGCIEGLSLAPVAFVMNSIVLRSMDSALEEAAHVSGANLFETLRRVTLPLAWPGMQRKTA